MDVRTGELHDLTAAELEPPPQEPPEASDHLPSGEVPVERPELAQVTICSAWKSGVHVEEPEAPGATLCGLEVTCYLDHLPDRKHVKPCPDCRAELERRWDAGEWRQPAAGTRAQLQAEVDALEEERQGEVRLRRCGECADPLRQHGSGGCAADDEAAMGGCWCELGPEEAEAAERARLERAREEQP